MNVIKDINNIPENIGNFSTIVLVEMNLENLNFLKVCTNMKTLWLEDTNVSNLKYLHELPKLDTLRIEREKHGKIEVNIKDIDGLQIKDLRFLRYTPCLSVLRDMPKLERLVVLDCDFSDLTHIRNFEGLRKLHLTSTKVKNLSPLRGMKIEKLSLNHTPVYDLSPLSSLHDLKSLDLFKTHVKDLLPLEHLYNLTYINLSYYTCDFPSDSWINGKDNLKIETQLGFI